MRRLVLLIVATLAFAVTGAAPAATINVQITRGGFVPQNVTVKQGDTVTWTNTDTVAHQVVFKNAACTLTIQPGQQGSCTFTTTGKLNYSDPTQRGGKFNGSVTVQAGPASVSLQSAKKTVVYGGSTTLSGRISTGQANQQVAILAQGCGQSASTQIATVTTTTGGAYTYVAKPLLNTTYAVKWKSATSAQVLVKVRPKIRLAKLAAHKFSVKVSAATTFAGKYVLFQRYSATLSRWVTVRRVSLRATTLGVAPTVVSARTFKSTVKSRLRVRAFLPQAQVGGCYAGGAGNVIRS